MTTSGQLEFTEMFNETINIKEEGVYYTMFLYEYMSKEKLQQEAKYDVFHTQGKALS